MTVSHLIVQAVMLQALRESGNEDSIATTISARALIVPFHDGEDVV
jgi:hypothetical protein